jgi:Flp pilus assembly pilin Flp
MRLVTKLVKWNHKGQSLIEYALVAAVVSAAIVAMSTYVYRSVQATQQAIQKEFSSQ